MPFLVNSVFISKIPYHLHEIASENYSARFMTMLVLPLKAVFSRVTWHLTFYGTFHFTLCSTVHAAQNELTLPTAISRFPSQFLQLYLTDNRVCFILEVTDIFLHTKPNQPFFFLGSMNRLKFITINMALSQWISEILELRTACKSCPLAWGGIPPGNSHSGNGWGFSMVVQRARNVSKLCAIPVPHLAI